MSRSSSRVLWLVDCAEFILIDVFDPAARSACWMLFEVSWAPLKLALNFLVLPAMLMTCKRMDIFAA
ncbi:hypothetical protein DY966_30575 [Pseudomonas aeruginosa]|nr:hypothetical protein DY966_30575 [Pseudomonas aeruginosa]